jgi:hypothetical protein
MYQTTIENTKWPQNIPCGRKIDQTATKYTNIFYLDTLQNVPKLGYNGFENIPSGNPVLA